MKVTVVVFRFGFRRFLEIITMTNGPDPFNAGIATTVSRCVRSLQHNCLSALSGSSVSVPRPHTGQVLAAQLVVDASGAAFALVQAIGCCCYARHDLVPVNLLSLPQAGDVCGEGAACACLASNGPY